MYAADQGTYQRCRMKPTKVNILGKTYKIIYCNTPEEVDADGKEPLCGQIDYVKKHIRVYNFKESNADLWHTILHEIIHGISYDLKIKALDGDHNDDTVDILALALMDVLFRNKWLKE